MKDGRFYIKNNSMVIAINLTSMCCACKEKKWLNITHTEERSVHTNSESCKQIIQILQPIIIEFIVYVHYFFYLKFKYNKHFNKLTKDKKLKKSIICRNQLKIETGLITNS